MDRPTKVPKLIDQADAPHEEQRSDHSGQIKRDGDSMVEVAFFKERGTGRHFIRVRIMSDAKMRQHVKLWTQCIIFPDQYLSMREIDRAVAIAGGAVAEKQCEEYGDRHDPDWCAKAALEIWQDLKTHEVAK